MPLCATANMPSADRKGCALRSVAFPWVAQRVCPSLRKKAEARLIELFFKTGKTARRLAKPDSLFSVYGNPAAVVASVFEFFYLAAIKGTAGVEPLTPKIPHISSSEK